MSRNRAHLLVTDDSPEIVEMVKAGLGPRYDCKLTSSLEQAHIELATDTFQVAICDLQTPREAGLTQLKEIARDYPETALVLIADVDSPEVTERTFQIGAPGYLVKPFWPGQLLITVKNVLRQRQLELALKAKGVEDLRASRQETVERLAMAIETHDLATGSHVARMASIAALLAAKLGFSENRLLLVRAAAPDA